MDKDRLPRWGWMLVALFSVTILANMLNVVVLGPAGLAEEYHVVTVIAAMALVLIYVGVWYDEERQEYWEFRTERIVGDVIFVVVGAIVGSGLAIVSIGEFGFSRLLQDVLAMVSGFVVAWGLFWWRNPELYRSEDDGR
ncbi:hypothetical protein [Natrialba swarupiae]|uniref:Uncharacterized protein n=1 Tax=Natrialba swarupiae TaxID=2448032 RepID=A0A5D5AS96_9EURY|nr:hypothetical protein [Natrialba swarupiae]TYT61941.1 hypothetical protein FYC77_10725 [Natrialba swarupiae]